MNALPFVRVRLKYADLDTFVERFAPNVTRGGIFLASRDPRPVGETIRFEVTLLSGASVMTGEGRVTWTKPWIPAEPQRPHGMGVQFTQLDAASRLVLERLLAQREWTSRSGGTGTGSRRAEPPRASKAGGSETPPANTEFDAVEETTVRRMMDRARLLSTPTDDVEDLLKDESEEALTVSQALSDLPRFLSRGRGSGFHRAVTERTGAGPPSTSAAPAPVESTPSVSGSSEPPTVETEPRAHE